MVEESWASISNCWLVVGESFLQIWFATRKTEQNLSNPEDNQSVHCAVITRRLLLQLWSPESRLYQRLCVLQMPMFSSVSDIWHELSPETREHAVGWRRTRQLQHGTSSSCHKCHVKLLAIKLSRYYAAHIARFISLHWISIFQFVLWTERYFIAPPETHQRPPPPPTTFFN